MIDDCGISFRGTIWELNSRQHGKYMAHFTFSRHTMADFTISQFSIIYFQVEVAKERSRKIWCQHHDFTIENGISRKFTWEKVEFHDHDHNRDRKSRFHVNFRPISLFTTEKLFSVFTYHEKPIQKFHSKLDQSYYVYCVYIKSNIYIQTFVEFCYIPITNWYSCQ